MGEQKLGYLVTDLDRIDGGLIYGLPEALLKADELAKRYPGNEIHIFAPIGSRKVERGQRSIDEEAAKLLYPSARAHEYGPGGNWPKGRWAILSGYGSKLQVLGRGHAEQEAWADVGIRHRGG